MGSDEPGRPGKDRAGAVQAPRVRVPAGRGWVIRVTGRLPWTGFDSRGRACANGAWRAGTGLQANGTGFCKPMGRAFAQSRAGRAGKRPQGERGVFLAFQGAAILVREPGSARRERGAFS